MEELKQRLAMEQDETMEQDATLGFKSRAQLEVNITSLTMQIDVAQKDFTTAATLQAQVVPVGTMRFIGHLPNSNNP